MLFWGSTMQFPVGLENTPFKKILGFDTYYVLEKENSMNCKSAMYLTANRAESGQLHLPRYLINSVIFKKTLEAIVYFHTVVK